jgi:hypothetical protein
MITALALKPINPLKAVVPLWFLLALAGSVLGVFDSRQGPPILVGAAAILPVAASVIWYRRSSAFRQLVFGADLRLLTLAQAWRVAGLLFVILYYRGALPGTFALPAGWGDFAIGITAPLVAWSITTRKKFPKRTFVAWNVIGLLDLVMAVSLGVLASRGLPGEVTTELMGRFPLSLAPTFFVPLLVIFHLISLIRVRHE